MHERARETNPTGGIPEEGFTLIEVMMALAITLILSASIYLLMNSAQTAFVKQPATSALQQNMRLAMDVISKDVLQAGDGLAPFMQAFTPGLSALGVPGSLTGGN